MMSFKSPQKGFTVIELLIATSVFSVILLVITSGFMQIGRAYYRGLNESRVQSVTRDIIDEVAQTIQFSGSNNTGVTGAPLVNGSTSGYCIGSTVYSYRVGTEVDGTNHALVAHTVSPAVGCGPAATPQALPATPQPTSRELLGDRMRISKFDVVQVAGTTDLYSITVRVLYGDDDLLCSESDPPLSSGGCSSPEKMSLASSLKPDLKCKDIRTGTQFCATSELKTTVQRRI